MWVVDDIGDRAILCTKAEATEVNLGAFQRGNITNSSWFYQCPSRPWHSGFSWWCEQATRPCGTNGRVSYPWWHRPLLLGEKCGKASSLGGMQRFTSSARGCSSAHHVVSTFDIRRGFIPIPVPILHYAQLAPTIASPVMPDDIDKHMFKASAFINDALVCTQLGEIGGWGSVGEESCRICRGG